MSLPDDRVLGLLRERFVLGWKNIAREDYVGASHGYTCEDHAVGTTNGAGARNVQMMVLSRGGVVVHALPGFWHPEDLATELRFGEAMHQLWTDNRPTSQKRRLFQRMQRAAPRSHSEALVARSGWQGFDERFERELAAKTTRDTFYYDEQLSLIHI